MFDIGFPELILVSVVALLVLGPERLPEALRTLGLWLGRLRRSFSTVKAEIEREIGMDEIRRQLHNEAVMEDIKRIEKEVRDTGAEARSIGAGHTDAAAPTTPPAASAELDAPEGAREGAPDAAREGAPDAAREGAPDAAREGAQDAKDPSAPR